MRAGSNPEALMANEEQVALLKQGADAWNAWRERNLDILPDLSQADFTGMDITEADLAGADLRKTNLSRSNLTRADLTGVDITEADLGQARLRRATLRTAKLRRANFNEANLSHADLTGADLYKAYLSGAYLSGTDLNEANLNEANFNEANLSGADLRGANLSRADLTGADLRGANLSRADLTGANLTYAHLADVDLTAANLTDCRIYGVSAWGLKLSKDTKQQNLIITPDDEPEVTVDNIEVAQFVYLLLTNPTIRNVIGTIGKKGVLILGRFTDERKKVLAALREELRKHDYVPILFDFKPSTNLDVTETIKVLAGLARFVIADMTDATDVRVELHNIIEDFTSLAVQPILLKGQPEFVSLSHRKKHPWLLPTFEYESLEDLLANLGTSVIPRAEEKVLELRGETTQQAPES
jgi:uncharacterized protein YjbI with pentapeptide repeats